jgi:cob(I)alamin adenosyltransferase
VHPDLRDLEQSADLGRERWKEVQRRIAEETYDLLVLNKFTYPMVFGWIPVDEVVVLQARPGFQHVIVTGRDAPPELAPSPILSRRCAR